MREQKEFSEFQAGDIAVFEKSFTPEAFTNFAELSGDHNPLHHDEAYAAESEFLRPIVPMHMTIAPLSRIAGMIFPGDPSLYLSHEIRSIQPVYYGNKLTYSAKIVAVNSNLRTLTIRVLVLQGTKVVIEANLRVMSRLDSWKPSSAQPDLAPAPTTTLITGATGEIGTALALHLARRGHNLLLMDRGAGPKRDALSNTLTDVAKGSQRIDFLAADLSKVAEVEALCRQLASRGDITSVFHSASPPLTASLTELVQVNYSALQKISEAVLPAMLIQQEGVLANIGTVATERVVPGWHNYAAAKAMAGQFLGAFDKSNSGFGVRGLNILSGLVATAYSKSAQGTSPAMAPPEIAEEVAQIALDERAGGAVMVEWNGKRYGAMGFHENRTASAQTATLDKEKASPSAPTDIATSSVESKIASVLHARFNLPADTDLSDSGVGNTPGWDSLRHIELVLELEALFGIRYSASDVEKMLTYKGLVSVTRARVETT